VRAIVFRTPEAAVNDQHQRARFGARVAEPHVGELVALGAIRDDFIGRTRFACEH
jgi:hypothetical protein